MNHFGKLMLLAVLSTSPLFASTERVNCNHDNLQEAIDEADPGDVLKIRGTCEGPFVVNKALKLIGPATLSAPNGGFAVLDITEANVTLQDLNIHGSGTGSQGIYVEGVSAKLSNVVVEGSEEGMRVSGAGFALVEQSQFRNNVLGLLVIGSGSFRMHETTIEQNAAFGILMFGSSSGLMFFNVIQNNGGTGVSVHSSGSLQISGTTIRGNGGAGIDVSRYSFINMFDPPNTIEGHGVDVLCSQQGGLFVASPQISTTKSAADDGTCIIDGTIF